MLERWFLLGMVIATVSLVTLAPWAILYEAYTERDHPAHMQINPIGVFVSVIICIFEILMLIDYLFGLGSPF